MALKNNAMAILVAATLFLCVASLPVKIREDDCVQAKKLRQEPARNLNIDAEDLQQVLEGKVDAEQMMKEKQREVAMFFDDIEDCSEDEAKESLEENAAEETLLEGKQTQMSNQQGVNQGATKGNIVQLNPDAEIEKM